MDYYITSSTYTKRHFLSIVPPTKPGTTQWKLLSVKNFSEHFTNKEPNAFIKKDRNRIQVHKILYEYMLAIDKPKILDQGPI